MISHISNIKLGLLIKKITKLCNGRLIVKVEHDVHIDYKSGFPVTSNDIVRGIDFDFLEYQSRTIRYRGSSETFKIFDEQLISKYFRIYKKRKKSKQKKGA